MSRAILLAIPLALAASSVVAAAPPADGATAPRTLVVSPAGPFTSIQAALAESQDGDEIQVRGGTYPGPLVVDRAVKLSGIGWPVVDGGGRGTVVTLAAPGIRFAGFEVRGSGIEPDRDHAGIAVAAPRVTVEGNRLREVLFGVFVAQADEAVIRGNDIGGMSRFDLGRKGDAIRLWYSARARVEGNRVHDSRDVVIWYSSGVVVRDNRIESGRYGVHLMYCDGAVVERNVLRDNSVGIYTMYSNRVALRENDVRGQRGPSGYALGLKDADDVEVAGNLLVDNRAGLFLDGTPFSPQGFARFDSNVVAFNDVGAILMPAVRGAVFVGNTFWENVEQVAVQGGGTLGANEWSGNYWSDYSGFDSDGDGTGDLPYRAERFFEGLTDREPSLRALLYSPSAQAVEFAAASFPIVRPQPKLADPSPLIRPALLPDWIESASRGGREMAGPAALLLGLGLGCVGMAFSGGSRSVSRSRVRSNADRRAVQLSVAALGKRYGRVAALDGVTFEAREGEALALWGANGAGKTTLLKAILGLIDFRGQVLVAGHDVHRAGKAARRQIGYVPQEAAFYDMSLQATIEFYARLKGAGTDCAPALLQQLGLAEHERKPVSALSGGLKQRLALAIALLASPPILLLDEPTANLDARARRDYLSLLAGLRAERRTIVFASHRLEEVRVLADRVLILDGGRLIEECAPETLASRALPEVELTVWVPEAHQPPALDCLAQAGLSAHLNGRGTVVVRLHGDEKLKALRALEAGGIPILDFDVERGQSWN